jgi:DNA invertase Pin-like site-specific DNA recombinase
MNPPDTRCPANPTGPQSRPSAPLPGPIKTPDRPAKVQPEHLERLAFVYVRQSSPYQVMFNKESAEVQIKLRDLAIAWGWPPSRVIVVTDDQGQSGRSAERRTGFHRLLDEVNLDHAGIIFGFQVSRLSRANSDWYYLQERCAVFHTLLADLDGVYDPTQYNDRLVLGMKGTMSEAELHFIGQRLHETRRNKALRGELFTMVPIGYVRLPGDRVALDPDEQVQHVVRLIFDKFDELGSSGAVLRYLVGNDIKLGVRVQNGPDAGRLEWRPPRRSTLSKILWHPFYAGCYVYPLNREDPRRAKPGRPRSGRTRVERLTWEVMIPDKVPAYITWDRYLANQGRLAANRFRPTAVGAPRRGPSLLSGLVYCGRCGRRMRVAYHATGTPVYYMCDFRRDHGCAKPICQSLAGRTLEALVTEEVLRALEPAALELHAAAVADLEREWRQQDQHWQLRLERARIEAERAARQYHAVEPENRLVARELERRWEQALSEQRELREEYDRFSARTPRELTDADRRRVEALATSVPELWHDPSTPVQDRQTIIRSLVERITVAVRGRTEWVDVTIRWFGGCETRHEVCRPVQKYEQLSNYQLLHARLVELRNAGATAQAIAERLNVEGFRSPHGPACFDRHVVHQLLAREGLSRPGTNRRTDRGDLSPHEWRLDDLARELSMPERTLRHWQSRGWVLGWKSSDTTGCWVCWADDQELDRLRRLRAWRRGGYNQVRPQELTTPRCCDRAAAVETSAPTSRSGRDTSKSRRRTRE